MKVTVNWQYTKKWEGDDSDPEDEWYDTYKTSEIVSVIPDPKGRFELEGYARDPNLPNVHIVSVIYGDSNTFGKVRGCRFILDVFDSLEDAETLKKLIEEDYAHLEENDLLEADVHIRYKGKEYLKLWKGWSEFLEEVCINTLPVTWKSK